MQTTTSLQAFLASEPVPAHPARAFTPPAHVKRWTGRAIPTIRLPSLAALRIAGADAFAARSAAGLGRN